MVTPTITHPLPVTEPSPGQSVLAAGDRFLMGLSVMLVANVLQRVIGLLRNLGFCHFLSDAELGQWSMANSFFVIAAPIAVLGLPGSFGKFVEIYRRQGALGTYLRCLTLFAGCGLVGLSCVMCLAPSSVAWLVFNDAQLAEHIGWLISTLAAVTIFNFINELMSALRQVRVVSTMQFVNSLSFAVLGTIGLASANTWSILLPCYTLACLLAMIPGIWVLRTTHAKEISGLSAAPGMWSRVFPFAVALWCMNLLSNLFDVCDRALLLHLTADVELAQSLIGQYHCGRLIPNLLISVASLLSGILLPYLSADFESGDRQRLIDRMRQTLQTVAVLFGSAAIVAWVSSPIIFQWMLGGRYEEAEQILPLALLQCIWMSLFLLAQTYLFCVEKGRHVAGILVVGLIVNALLNYPLIMAFGLAGSVGATTLASGLILACVLWRISVDGGSLGWRTTLLCFLPALLSLLMLV
ncbi:MAG: lipopolysaccharide biosynthesis protein [Pirellulaceae bacterium]|nr:lipopolysaccharide biosynthesis protein [Pirellulaceae bacterium]